MHVANVGRSRIIKYVLLTSLLALHITTQAHTLPEVNALALIISGDFIKSRAYSVTTYNYMSYVSMEQALLRVNLINYSVDVMHLRGTPYTLLHRNNSLLGFGKLGDSAYILYLDLNTGNILKSFNVVINGSSALYDAALINEHVVATGYALLRGGTYSTLVVNASIYGSTANAYIVNCPTGCYGRKVLQVGGNELVVIGSVFTKSSTLGWSYKVFITLISSNQLKYFKYVDVNGNNYVVNAYVNGGKLYIIANSDAVGSYLMSIKLPEADLISISRILINGNPVTCSSTAMHGNLLTLTASDLLMGSKSYIAVVNLSDLAGVAYEVSNVYLHTLNAVDGAKGYVIIGNTPTNNTHSTLVAFLNIDEMPKSLRNSVVISFNEAKLSFKDVLADLKSVSTDMVIHDITLKAVDELSEWVTPVLSIRKLTSHSEELLSTTQPLKPGQIQPQVVDEVLYTHVREVGVSGDELTLIALGLTLIAASLLLKYLMRLRS